MKKLKLITASILAASQIALLMGCGTSGSTDTAAAAATTAAAETAAATEAATESASATPTIDKIKAAGKLKLATGTYVPFEYEDESGNVVGFDIDLAQYIADRLGVELEVNVMEFQSIIPSIQNGDYDLSIAAMYKTDERQTQVLMSDSYCDSGMVLAVKAGGEYDGAISGLADCGGLKVAVKEGATSCKVAESFLEENPDVTYDIVQYKDTVGCVSDLLAGRVDVVVNDLLNMKELEKEYPDAKIVTDTFTHAENAAATAFGTEDLMDFVNECIADFKADGTYDKCWDKWIEGKAE